MFDMDDVDMTKLGERQLSTVLQSNISHVAVDSKSLSPLSGQMSVGLKDRTPTTDFDIQFKPAGNHHNTHQGDNGCGMSGSGLGFLRPDSVVRQSSIGSSMDENENENDNYQVESKITVVSHSNLYESMEMDNTTTVTNTNPMTGSAGILVPQDTIIEENEEQQDNESIDDDIGLQTGDAAIDINMQQIGDTLETETNDNNLDDLQTTITIHGQNSLSIEDGEMRGRIYSTKL
eukprot:CAMPEP_0201586656 /NCGR_PEP_ID=MMETSP0190_2-20130828/135056_1 /ASSEMBLY_ACC=CAM_ASM_000263 /TAXON_ID=37353 /ORGANISM="Rosalina sp." /LENGTH=232 /DNA_ID=CAMNT_0048035071 /DNA_START=677 /DNA_END=1375 /DNA_ORIENTATION=+